jgi:hypothetical protein
MATKIACARAITWAVVRKSVGDTSSRPSSFRSAAELSMTTSRYSEPGRQTTNGQLFRKPLKPAPAIHRWLPPRRVADLAVDLAGVGALVGQLLLDPGRLAPRVVVANQQRQRDVGVQVEALDELAVEGLAWSLMAGSHDTMSARARLNALTRPTGPPEPCAAVAVSPD